MTLALSTVTKCKDADSDFAKRIGLNQWMEKSRRDQLTPLSSGANGVRTYGRLALLAGTDLGLLMTRIKTSINQLLANQPAAANANGAPNAPVTSLRVFVVASAGGGSGSGFFIDVGYLTRFLLPANGAWEQVGIVAVAPRTFALDENVARGRHQNSAALLDEMDHFTQQNTIFKVNYNGENLPELIGQDPPYQHCYLVSPMAGGGALRDSEAKSIEVMQQTMADMMFLRMTGPGEIGARQSDFAENFSNHSQDRQGYPNAFSTFGVTLRQFPAKKYFDESLGKAMMKMANQWLKPGAPKEQLAALCEQEYADFQRGLGLPAKNVQGRRRPRDKETDQAYLRLIAVSENPLVGMLRNAQTPTELKTSSPIPQAIPLTSARQATLRERF